MPSPHDPKDVTAAAVLIEGLLDLVAYDSPGVAVLEDAAVCLDQTKPGTIRRTDHTRRTGP